MKNSPKRIAGYWMTITLLLGCSGCFVQSFHPFYTDAAKINPPSVTGEWDLVKSGADDLTAKQIKPWTFREGKSGYDVVTAWCDVKYGKRILFPSTSEVYGMSGDAEFDPYKSNLVLGPIDKQRWIYSCSKQLMDRVIWAYGSMDQLDFTLFRPFNWIGAGLDSIHTAKEGSSRVITQFLGHIVRGEPIKLVDGGQQKRAFTYIDDGIAALMKIIENKDGVATGKIYNVGNPANNYSVRELAQMMLDLAREYPEYRDNAAKVKLVEVTSGDYYGKGYQDVQNRVPAIRNTMQELGWKPQVDMQTALARIFDAYRGQLEDARALAS
jgi:nucleoside-diphosphate-sugar epimerase